MGLPGNPKSLRCIMVMILLWGALTLVVGSMGTAGSYDPHQKTSTECKIGSGEVRQSAAVNEGLWEGGAACGRRYRLTCLSGADEPCKEGTIDVEVVDFCPRSLCPSTLTLPKDVFAAISRLPDAKINIEFIEV